MVPRRGTSTPVFVIYATHFSQNIILTHPPKREYDKTDEKVKLFHSLGVTKIVNYALCIVHFFNIVSPPSQTIFAAKNA